MTFDQRPISKFYEPIEEEKLPKKWGENIQSEYRENRSYPSEEKLAKQWDKEKKLDKLEFQLQGTLNMGRIKNR